MKIRRFFSPAGLGSGYVEGYIQGGVLLNLQIIHCLRNRWNQGVIATHVDCQKIDEVERFKKQELSKYFD